MWQSENNLFRAFFDSSIVTLQQLSPPVSELYCCLTKACRLCSECVWETVGYATGNGLLVISLWADGCIVGLMCFLSSFLQWLKKMVFFWKPEYLKWVIFPTGHHPCIFKPGDVHSLLEVEGFRSSAHSCHTSGWHTGCRATPGRHYSLSVLGGISMFTLC